MKNKFIYALGMVLVAPLDALGTIPVTLLLHRNAMYTGNVQCALEVESET